jgi:hypothetical protein
VVLAGDNMRRLAMFYRFGNKKPRIVSPGSAPLLWRVCFFKRPLDDHRYRSSIPLGFLLDALQEVGWDADGLYGVLLFHGLASWLFYCPEEILSDFDCLSLAWF